MRVETKSQVELHPIIGDFPTGFTHGAMFGTVFIQHRVRIVDVGDDPLGLSETKWPLQHAALAPEGKMSHIARRPSAALSGDEFVVLPKSAIKKGQIAFIHGAQPVVSES